LHRVSIGNDGSASEALYNHKAFNYFPSLGLLVIPVEIADYKWASDIMYGETVSSVFISYKVSVDEGFEYIGDIDHTPLEKECYKDVYSNNEYCFASYNSPRRSIIIEDYLYTISDKWIKVGRTFSTDIIKTIPLPSLSIQEGLR